MQVFNFIVNNFQKIAIGSAFMASNIYLVKLIIQRKQLVDKYRTLFKKKILTVQQALQLQQNNKQNAKKQTFLIKGSPDSQKEMLSCRKELRSNQYWILEPSLNKVANQFIKLLNQSFVQKKKKSIKKLQQTSRFINSQWSLKSKNDPKANSIKIKGFGQIADNQMFQIKANYIKDQQKGILKILYETIAYYIQFIFFEPLGMRVSQQQRKRSQNQNRSTFIKGPVIGWMIYSFRFLKDRSILVQARIQNNQILPITISSSKQSILQNLNSKIWSLDFKIAGLLIVSYIGFRMLSPTIRRLYRSARLQIKQMVTEKNIFKTYPKQFKMQQNVSQQHLCIICYTNCRNTIIFNCRHLIMCNQCKDIYKDRNCPLCKNQIDDQKILAQA